MDAGAWVGIAIGLGGLGLGLGVMLAIPLGMFNRFLRVFPDPGVSPITADELRTRLLGLNEERRPWTIRPSTNERRANLVAEWRIADSRWWGAFQRNGLKRSYRALIRLDDGTHEVRITEESGEVSWSAGAEGVMPALHWSRSFFHGVILFERAREIAYGIKDALPLEIGAVAEYDFDPWRVKGPILQVTVEGGWTYVPVVHAFQLGRPRPMPPAPAAR